MKKNIGELNSTLERINQDHTLLDIVLEVERILDMNHIYAYQNWEKGELVEGPFISRYWVKTVWMYPHKLMPDPDGGLRLMKYDCKVLYEKSILEVPTEVKTARSYIPGTTKPKLEEKPIWLVSIIMPRRFVDEFMTGNTIFDDEVIDNEDITTAYDQGLDQVQREEEGEDDIDLGDDADEMF